MLESAGAGAGAEGQLSGQGSNTRAAQLDRRQATHRCTVRVEGRNPDNSSAQAAGLDLTNSDLEAAATATATTNRLRLENVASKQIYIYIYIGRYAEGEPTTTRCVQYLPARNPLGFAGSFITTLWWERGRRLLTRSPALSAAGNPSVARASSHQLRHCPQPAAPRRS